jgi:hypothetical protein
MGATRQAQATFDACMSAGGERSRCIDEAEAKRVALGGDPQAPFEPWEPGAEIGPTTIETSPDGTKWFSRICYCPIAECQGAMNRDCPEGFAVEGQASNEPLGEYSKFRQRRGYQIKYRCQEPKSSAPDGPAPAPPTPGCTKDTDCKGDRVCDNGRCVTPKPDP